MKLLCEYLCNPVGIDTPSPRLSWMGGRQSAYRICAATSLESLNAGCYNLWDTGIVEGTNCTNIPYAGRPLASLETCWWKVYRTGDTVQESEPACFTTAILNKNQWCAEWLGSAVYHSGTSLLLRRSFPVAKELRSAYAVISATGFYECHINGRRIEQGVLEPPVCNQDKTILYRMYDVKASLQYGDNVIGLLLGKGWAAYPSGFLQLYIAYTDGSEDWVCTELDENWRVRGGFILDSSIYNGEYCDGAIPLQGWATPAYRPDSAWKKPLLMEPPCGEMRAALVEPIQKVRELLPKDCFTLESGAAVYDFGQNFAGWARLELPCRSAAPVSMKYAELLSPDGTVNQKNLRKAKCTDLYLPDPTREHQRYEPRFTYHGFRYVQVEGLPGDLHAGSLTGIQLRSGVARTGSFTCSNPLLNRLQQNIIWTEESNLYGIPTDCPQRDERRGWLNDMTVRTEMALYNFHLANLYTKWVQDIRDTQGSRGAIADTAPFVDFGRRPADPVSSSYLVVPWMTYLFYADKRILSQFYEGMTAWQAYLAQQADGYLLEYSYYGDWAPPSSQSESGSIGAGAVSGFTPGSLISTGYFYYNACLLEKIAEALGKAEDSEKYRIQGIHIAAAFHSHFYQKAGAYYGENNQAANAFALYMGLVPEGCKAAVLNSLLENLEAADWHFTTGNLCTKYLVEVLSENGLIDEAYRLMTQITYPSYGYMLENGATTVWERWERVESGSSCDMASHNHPMYGSVGAWFYKYLAGIQLDEAHPGFENVIIAPVLPSGLESAQAELETPRGTLRIKVFQEAGSWRLEVAVPANGTADVLVPYTQASIIQIDGETLEAAESKGTFKERRRQQDRMVFEEVRGYHTFEVHTVNV